MPPRLCYRTGLVGEGEHMTTLNIMYSSSTSSVEKYRVYPLLLRLFILAGAVRCYL